MSVHIDKALAAIDAARELPDHLDPLYLELLHVAHIQAEVATAIALERLADRFT